MAGKINATTAQQRPLLPQPTEHTPFTRFIVDRLNGPSKDSFALLFAPQMKFDKDAQVFDLADTLPWLGITIDSAAKVLKIHFTENEYKQENPSKIGVRYWISLDIFEDLMMHAGTEQGRLARTMYKQMRNAVHDFELDEEEGKRIALEKELQTERATKARLAARKADEDVPAEKVYLMKSQGLIKIGLTTGEVSKRQKQMETGNPDISTIFSVDCIDARLIERNMHFMLRWYKRKGEWYDIDERTASILLKTTKALLDGVRRLELDEVDVSTALGAVLKDSGVRLSSNSLPSKSVKSPPSPPIAVSSKNAVTEMNILDQWLVDRLASQSLPSIILSRNLAKELTADGSDIQPNWVTNQLRRYEHKGVDFPKNQRHVGKERGRAIKFDSPSLQETLVRIGFIRI